MGEYPYGGSHSLSQLWVIDGENGSDVEYGWTESPGLYKGNTEPHLFVYHFNHNEGTEYDADFVQEPGSPSITAPIAWNNGANTYGIDDYSGNWWVYHDGYWLGYLPAFAWTYLIRSRSLRTEAGGEVASTTNSTTCDWMGAGQFGSSSGSAWWEHTWFEYAGSSYYPQWGYTYASDSSAYDLGFVNLDEGAFHYGGPGYYWEC